MLDFREITSVFGHLTGNVREHSLVGFGLPHTYLRLEDGSVARGSINLCKACIAKSHVVAATAKQFTTLPA